MPVEYFRNHIMAEQTGRKSLSEVNETVDTPKVGSRFRRLMAFLGPAYLISVGYMDPGNWATDIAGGSAFGYKLLWVLLMSNLIALLLQSLSARLGIVRRLDLAQASRETYPKAVNIILWLLAEVAIAACDLAEVLGMAIGLKLIFGLPLVWGVTLTAFDSFLLIFLLNYGVRKMEAFIIALVGIIGLAFLVQLLIAKPDMGHVVTGLVPSKLNIEALYIAIGIIGATVMPHNLYLHSSLVQTRRFDRTPASIAKAIKYNIIDSTIALNAAFFVNAAILILAATTFFNNGLYEIASIEEAHAMLSPLLGSSLAPILFGVALIAAGQSSTITGTLAGQIVMEGYLDLRIQPWIRRLITRLVAIVPALVVILYYGEQETDRMLVFSQVVLSLQLGFAIIPLIHLVSDRKEMGDFAISLKTKLAAWLSASIIIGLNLNLVFGMFSDWVSASAHKTLILATVGPLLIGFVGLLAYTIVSPLLARRKFRKYQMDQRQLLIAQHSGTDYRKIAITIDFSSSDNETINAALAQGGPTAHYVLINVVETVGAFFMGKDAGDHAVAANTKQLELYRTALADKGYDAEILIGYGNPKTAIPKLVAEYKPDLLVMGAHGHNTFKDLIFGTTLNTVRHRVDVPLLIVRQTK